jgi:hypothetical protein
MSMVLKYCRFVVTTLPLTKVRAVGYNTVRPRNAPADQKRYHLAMATQAAHLHEDPTPVSLGAAEHFGVRITDLAERLATADCDLQRPPAVHDGRRARSALHNGGGSTWFPEP